MSRKCPKCQMKSEVVLKYGHFKRLSDKKKIKRFKCSFCREVYSQAFFQKCYRQKKRRLNPRILELLCSEVSQRRIALILKINRKTVAKKLIFLASLVRERNQARFNKLPLLDKIQFDDLETIEHTKCKPLSVTLAVEKDSRFMLGFQVSQMPAKGHLAKISYEKYGFRADLRAQGRKKLFSNIRSKVAPTATIESDLSPHYPDDVKRFFPKATHLSYLGRRSSIRGQGELKKVLYDPIFSINHTFAMCRANINRLIRKTWCTTKLPQRLSDHLDLYVYFHNHVLIKKQPAAAA